MLRTLRSPFVAPRVIPFSFSKVGAAFTDAYPGNQTAFANDGNGISTLTYRDPFASPSPIIVGSAVNTTATAPVYVVNRPANVASTRIYTSNAAGSNTDLPCMGFAIGQDARFTAHTGSLLHNVQCQYPNMVMSAMYVSTPDSVYYNLQGATITINGTGDTTITFPVSAAYPMIACVSTYSATSRRAWIHSTTQNSIRVLQRNAANGAAEAFPFVLFFMRQDSKNLSRGRKSLKTNQPEARLLFGRIRYSGGVPAWDTVAPGAGIGTLTDQGTGDVIITFPDAYKSMRNHFAIATPGQDALNFCTISSITDTTIRIKTFTIAGTNVAVDPTHIDFMALVYRNTGNFRG